jgi:Putative zinc-finger
MRMDHQEATRITAVEMYLLDELSAREREQFEEHFFECLECAADLRATAAFLDVARRELKPERGIDRRKAPLPARKSWLAPPWRSAVFATAFALSMLVVVYQNVLVLPRLASEVASLDNPELVQSVSLAAGNSRGATSAIKIAKGRALLLSVDIPAREEFSGYVCVLLSPSGSIVWRLPVSQDQAKDTVSIRVPPGRWVAGEYRLLVQGIFDRTGSRPAVDLAHYRFALNEQK